MSDFNEKLQRCTSASEQAQKALSKEKSALEDLFFFLKASGLPYSPEISQKQGSGWIINLSPTVETVNTVIALETPVPSVPENATVDDDGLPVLVAENDGEDAVRHNEESPALIEVTPPILPSQDREEEVPSMENIADISPPFIPVQEEVGQEEEEAELVYSVENGIKGFAIGLEELIADSPFTTPFSTLPLAQPPVPPTSLDRESPLPPSARVDVDAPAPPLIPTPSVIMPPEIQGESVAGLESTTVLPPPATVPSFSPSSSMELPNGEIGELRPPVIPLQTSYPPAGVPVLPDVMPLIPSVPVPPSPRVGDKEEQLPEPAVNSPRVPPLLPEPSPIAVIQEPVVKQSDENEAWRQTVQLPDEITVRWLMNYTTSPLRVPPGRTRLNPYMSASKDPESRARRLAKTLVGEIILYQPDAYKEASAHGTEALKEIFAKQIEMTRTEYSRQIDTDTLPHAEAIFNEELNTILFQGGL